MINPCCVTHIAASSPLLCCLSHALLCHTLPCPFVCALCCAAGGSSDQEHDTLGPHPSSDLHAFQQPPDTTAAPSATRRLRSMFGLRSSRSLSSGGAGNMADEGGGSPVTPAGHPPGLQQRPGSMLVAATATATGGLSSSSAGAAAAERQRAAGGFGSRGRMLLRAFSTTPSTRSGQPTHTPSEFHHLQWLWLWLVGGVSFVDCCPVPSPVV